MLRSSQYIAKKIIIADGNKTQIKGKPAQVGFDLSVKNIYQIVTPGFISKDKTYVSEYKLLPAEACEYDYKHSSDDGKTITYKKIPFQGWFLPKGAYLLEANEGCHFGPNDTGYIIQRSSLNRNNVTTVSSVWDPGFTTESADGIGTITIRIVVENESGVYLEQDARVAQMLVITNEDAPRYDGQYQGGRATSKLVK